MVVFGFFTLVFFAIFCLTHTIGDYIDQSPLVATCSPATTVQVFSSLVFIDLISVHDPGVVFGSNVPSDFAADKLFTYSKRIFDLDFYLPHSADIASTFSSAVSQLDQFSLPLYYLNTATIYGDYLVGLGLLSCDNVIERAKELVAFEQYEFQILDPTQLESYFKGIIQSWGDQLDVHGYDTEDEVHWQNLADLLYKKYSNYASQTQLISL